MSKDGSEIFGPEVVAFCKWREKASFTSVFAILFTFMAGVLLGQGVIWAGASFALVAMLISVQHVIYMRRLDRANDALYLQMRRCEKTLAGEDPEFRLPKQSGHPR